MAEPRRAASIAVVLGTRPEIIKLAPLLRQLGSCAQLVWTGQHYDAELTDVVFAAVGRTVPPVAVPGVGGTSTARQLATMVSRLVDRFEEAPPAAVVVQGDTNTANAGAQSARYCGVPVVHVEAGLRSWDRAMPEEINRQLVGVVADLHCCPTVGNADHLRRAGVAADAIRITGNTVVEATLDALPPIEAQGCLVEAATGLGRGDYAVATIHRPENTDDPTRLAEILAQLGALPWTVVVPAHPRLRQRLSRFGISWPAGVRAVAPVDHPSFLSLVARSRLVVSDSGGVQEEVTVLKRPLVVVRRSTERPESVAAGFARLVEPAAIGTAARQMTRPALLARLCRTPSPYGDGSAGRRIAEAVRSLLAGSTP